MATEIKTQVQQNPCASEFDSYVDDDLYGGDNPLDGTTKLDAAKVALAKSSETTDFAKSRETTDSAVAQEKKNAKVFSDVNDAFDHADNAGYAETSSRNALPPKLTPKQQLEAEKAQKKANAQKILEERRAAATKNAEETAAKKKAVAKKAAEKPVQVRYCDACELPVKKCVCGDDD